MDPSSAWPRSRAFPHSTPELPLYNALAFTCGAKRRDSFNASLGRILFGHQHFEWKFYITGRTQMKPYDRSKGLHNERETPLILTAERYQLL
jgi:hypothetical protein